MESCISNNAESRSPSPPPPRHGRTLFHEFEEEEEGVCYRNGFGWFKNEDREDPWETMKAKKKKKKQVFLEGYVETSDEDELGRTKSLTDDDLEELKGCLDLGFGFNYEEIPELRNTLPALELCYSMTQKYLDDHQKSPESMSDTASTSSASNPIANWKISSPVLPHQVMILKMSKLVSNTGRRQLLARSDYAIRGEIEWIRSDKKGRRDRGESGRPLSSFRSIDLHRAFVLSLTPRGKKDCISRELKAPETSFQERDTE